MLTIRPWEWARLTVDETDSLIEYLERRNAEIRRANG